MSYIDDRISSLDDDIAELDDWLKMHETIWGWCKFCIAAIPALIVAAVLLGELVWDGFAGILGGLAGFAGLAMIVTGMATMVVEYPGGGTYNTGIWKARQERAKKERERTKLILKREGIK